VKILVLHPGALGDIILSLPALGALRRHLPESQITFAANVDFSSIAAAGYAARLQSFSTIPIHGLFEPEPDARFWSGYDRVLSWTGAGNDAFETGLRSVHASSLVSSWRPRPGDLRHVSRNFLDSIVPWVGRAGLKVPEIRALPEDRTAAAGMLSAAGKREAPIVAVHPGAGSRTKRWPMQRFRDLAHRIVGSGAWLMVIEGPAEAGLCDELGLPESRVFHCRQLNLALQKGFLAHAGAFIGNDSGIAHLAAAMGLPTVVLFGPTLPENWAPLGEHVVTIRKPSGCLPDITPEEVLSALTEVVSGQRAVADPGH
jgi:heptosyltransferase-3